ncbi:MAG TPA: hypothetical protein VEO58_09910 [Gemmatimonadales bacterium]|nr:hypothetical protein [Gemmatimonadales bacterium]
MSPVITVTLPEEVYARRLHVLGAWWCLASSAIEPRLLIQCIPRPLTSPRAA